MTYPLNEAAPLALNRALKYSLALHGAVIVLFIVVPLLKPEPKVIKKAYLFQMVSAPPRPHVRYREPVPPAPAKAQPVTRTVKQIPVSKSKFTEKVKVRPEDMPVSQEDMPVSREDMPIPQDDVPISQDDMPVSAVMLSSGAAFRFSSYENTLQMAIKRNWNPPEDMLEGEDIRTVIVDFSVVRSGDVVDVRIKESSWNTTLDRQALRALELANLPPLPDGYEENRADFEIRLNLIKK